MVLSPLLEQTIQPGTIEVPKLVQSIAILATLIMAVTGSTILIAGPRDVAWKMHNRIAGVPPSEDIVVQMADLIAKNMPKEAARIAMESPYFYNLSLRNWMVPWSNKDQSPRQPLNDYVATMIGMVRDDVPFDQALYGDLVYMGKDGLTTAAGTAVPIYSKLNNDHYVALDTNFIDLKGNLVQRQQSTVTGGIDIAGVLTTRGFGAEYLDAGTNRRPIRFMLVNFMCNDMEQLMDTTRSDFHIRRDVTRVPGGDPSVFRSKCAGCHTGMDPLAGAWAHFDFVGGQVTYSPNSVVEKVNRNIQEFPEGYATVDDSWINLWTAGPNAALGWNGPTSGKGVNQLGRMFASSNQFSRCMASRVFQRVCLRDPAKSAIDQKVIQELADDFAASGKYSMKSLFASTSAACLGN